MTQAQWCPLDFIPQKTQEAQKMYFMLLNRHFVLKQNQGWFIWSC